MIKTEFDKSEFCAADRCCIEDEALVKAGKCNALSELDDSDVKVSLRVKGAKADRKWEAFLDLEAQRLACSEAVDFDKERSKAMQDKYGIFN